MTRTMYDAVTASNIPKDALIVGGYDDGTFKWTAADWALFPNAVHVHISSVGSAPTVKGLSRVLDCEPGNPNAVASVNWVLAERAAGGDPYVYTAEWATGYRWVDVQAAFAARGVPLPHWWKAPGAEADLGAPDEPLMVQTTYPGPYDVGVAADYLPGIEPADTGGDDLTPEQAQQLQAVYDWLAGTGNQGYALTQALYQWDSGTGNGMNAKLDQIISLLQPPAPKPST